jgi:hypothetical protein
MAGELKALRDAFLECKNTNSSFSEVTRCTVAALTIARDAIMADPKTSGILKCLPGEKEKTAYLLDLAELAEVGSFDLEDIIKAAPLACEGGNQGETSIDRIDLKKGFTYLVKHRGSVSDPIADAAVFTAPQLIAQVLDEDIPQFVWSNPRKGRFAMTWFPHKMSGGRSFDKYKPHEMVTTLIFETLLGDRDRNETNVVTLRDAILGHVDFGAVFAGLEDMPTSVPSDDLIKDIKVNARRFLQQYPDFKVALLEGIERWNQNWRPVLSRIDTSLTTPARLRNVDALLNSLAEDIGIVARAPGEGAFQYFEPEVPVGKTLIPTVAVSKSDLDTLGRAGAVVRRALEDAKEFIAQAGGMLAKI